MMWGGGDGKHLIHASKRNSKQDKKKILSYNLIISHLVVTQVHIHPDIPHSTVDIKSIINNVIFINTLKNGFVFLKKKYAGSQSPTFTTTPNARLLNAGEPRRGWGDCPRDVPTSTMRRCLSVGRRWYLTTSSYGTPTAPAQLLALHPWARSWLRWALRRHKRMLRRKPAARVETEGQWDPGQGNSLPASGLEKQAATVIRKSSFYFFIWDLSSPRRRQWHPTPVLLPGKSHGRRSLVGCSAWGR